MATSTDYNELTYVWTEWRNAASKPMRDDYINYVELSNKAAQMNNLADMGEMWVEPYELGNRTQFQEKMEGILEQTKPFYRNLHAYARMKLREERFGKEFIDESKAENSAAPIPSSVLGNMWAQVHKECL